MSTLVVEGVAVAVRLPVSVRLGDGDVVDELLLVEVSVDVRVYVGVGVGVAVVVDDLVKPKLLPADGPNMPA